MKIDIKEFLQNPVATDEQNNVLGKVTFGIIGKKLNDIIITQNKCMNYNQTESTFIRLIEEMDISDEDKRILKTLLFDSYQAGISFAIRAMNK